MKKILLYLFLSGLLAYLPACKGTLDSESTTEEVRLPGCCCDDGQYVPGEILVGFADTVSYGFVTNFLNEMDLEILDLDLCHNFWAVADSNNLAYYRNLFSTDSTVKAVNKLYWSTVDTLYITITFNGMNSLESDSVKVEDAGLHVYSVKRYSKWAHVSCEIGKEYEWTDSLLTYNFIRYAEPNFIVCVCYD